MRRAASLTRALGQEVEKFKDNRQILNLVMAYIPELTISPIYKKMKEMDAKNKIYKQTNLN